MTRRFQRGIQFPPEVQKLYAHQMEVYAGFQENTDAAVGEVVKAIENMGIADNTLIIYIWGDNGASMEGTETGTFNEITTLNGVPLTAEQQLKAIKAYGGLEKWGGPRMDPHYAAAWAWAGNAPFKWGKQVASHLGGIRNPMVVAWPKRIKDKGGIRSQFTHVMDLAPTILEVAGLPEPKEVNGVAQTPMQGVSLAFTFDDAKAPAPAHAAVFRDSWQIARCTRTAGSPAGDPTEFRGSSTPETMARFAPGKWDPNNDKCELYNLDEDYSQADNVAAQFPDKVRELTELFWVRGGKESGAAADSGEIAFAWGFPRTSYRPDKVHLLQRNGKHRSRHGSADLQPLVQHQRRPLQPGPIWISLVAARNRGRHRG